MKKVILSITHKQLVVIITIIAICLATLLNFILSYYLEGSFTINDFWRSLIIPLFLAPFIAWPLVQMTYRTIAVEKELKRITTYDSLTQVFSRQSFLTESQVSFEQSKHDSKDFSVILLDVDFFKNVNDNYGHHAGDYVLSKLGDLLKDLLIQGHLCGRIGGEEFAISMPNMDLENADKFAQLIHKKLSNSILIYNNTEITITLSIGVSSYKNDNTQFDELMIQADRALYQAKRAGRNQTALYSHDQYINAEPKTVS